MDVTRLRIPILVLAELVLSQLPAAGQESGRLRFRGAVEATALHAREGAGFALGVALATGRPALLVDAGLRWGEAESYRILHGGLEYSLVPQWVVSPFASAHLDLMIETEWAGPVWLVSGGARVGSPRLAARAGVWGGGHDGVGGPVGTFVGVEAVTPNRR